MAASPPTVATPRFVETARALVRPTVTWGLVAAFIAAAFADREVAGILAGPMGIAVGYYFKAREQEG